MGIPCVPDDQLHHCYLSGKRDNLGNILVVVPLH